MNSNHPASSNSVEMSPDVISAVVRRAALQVPGVASLGPHRLPPAVGRMLRTGHDHDVTITIDRGTATVELALVVSAPHNAVDVAKAVQEAVRQAVEKIAGLRVAAVHVRVEDVTFQSDEAA